MKKPTAEGMEERDHEQEDHHQVQDLEINSDLCQQLLDRYSRSSAPQHRHLCATAAAMRSILQSESIPFTPPAYFAAAISSVSDTNLDSTSAAAMLSFLSLTLPLVPPGSVPSTKAADAVSVLVNISRPPQDGEAVSASTARAAVKCLGFLVGFCDLEDWGSIKSGFEALVLYSVDRRPKVRKCAQGFVEKVFRSFQCSNVIKEASKLVLSLMKGYMPLAVKLNTPSTMDGSKREHLEVIHMLGVLKLIIPYLSVKVSSKMLSLLSGLLSSKFSPLTRHIFNAIDAFFETSKVEIIIPEAENIIASLAAYVSLGENPMDTVISAATLLKCALDKVQAGDCSIWSGNLPLVFGPIAGMLTTESNAASQASSLLKELISDHLDQKILLSVRNQLFEEANGSMEWSSIKSICGIFEKVLSACAGSANEHILVSISALFLKLGETSFFFMKAILLKLAQLMVQSSGAMSWLMHLHECIGSAVIAMGSERILTLLPISFHAEEKACSNIWLVPILKKYMLGARLGYFMEHIVPLAESIELASCQVKKSERREDLKTHAHDLLGLLPAFCRCSTDLHQNIAPLAKFFITSLNDPFLHETVAVSLQELVQRNRSILKPYQEENGLKVNAGEDPGTDSKKVSSSYSKKTATRNIRALASFSMQLLQSLTDVLYDSPPEKHSYLKDAIGCLAFITDPSVTKKIFISSLERFQLTDAIGELQNLGSLTLTRDREEGNLSSDKDGKRCQVLGLACSLVGGAPEDLIDLIYNFVRHTLLAANKAGQLEACYTLNRILEAHPWFCSSRCADLVDLLLGLKSTVDTAVLKSRFSCLHLLFVNALKTSEDDNTKIFLVLNEIILAMKDSNEEIRKAAYDTLLAISSSLRNSSSIRSDAPQNKLISMIMGYLSGSSPKIKSAAVSALSLLVYKDSDTCLSVPDIIPSLLALLQSRSVEVIKAVLGFMKVLVSCLEAKDMHNLLPDILNGVLPWSLVSRNHFRSKVTVILEIIRRKCGSAAIEFVAPEKYKGFIRTVKESRHGKPSSKDMKSTDTEPKSADSSSKRHPKQKRAHEEHHISHWENSSPVPKKRKEEKNNGFGNRANDSHMPSGSGSSPMKRTPYFCNHERAARGPLRARGGKNRGEFHGEWLNGRSSNNEKAMKGPLQGRGGKNRREFHSEQPSSRKGKTAVVKARGNDAAGHGPATALKSHKHKKARG